MISRKSIDEVLDRVRIEEVVQDFVNLKRRGSNLIGLCPFHHEKTPSFSVSPTRNIYKCFGCGKGGDSVRFVMEHESYDYPETIRYLANKYGVQLEETQQDEESLKAEKERETVYKILDFALKFFKKQLLETEEGQVAGLNYFKERGFRNKTIEDFGLGYASQSLDAFVTEALNSGFTKEILHRAGLITQAEGDFFRHRVIFPIFNISGKVIAFAGRQLTSNKRSPKYINSPETEIYNKRKVLYGLFHAKKAIREKDNCFLVEGYTDVISLHQAGIENVVASSGTALTPDQIRLIKRYASRITVLYDSDPAGIKAAMRGLELILEENLDIQLVLLPEGEDPDSFVQKVGMAGFLDFIKEHGKDFILFKTQFLLKETANDPMQKAVMLKDLVETLAHIPEAIKRSAFVTQCAHLMRMDEHLLVNATNKAFEELLRQKKQGISRDIDRSESEIQRKIFDRETKNPDATIIDFNDLTDQYQERDIIRILLSYGDKNIPDSNVNPLSRYIIVSLLDIIDEIEHPVYKKIIDLYQSFLEKDQVPTSAYFTKHPDPDIQHLAIELLTAPYEYASWEEHDIPLQVQLHPDDNFKKDAHNAILRLKLKIVMKHIERNQAKITELQTDGNDEEIAIHIRIHYDLLKVREQITSQFKNVVLKV
ncbi:MAG TPA: DNA primase [Saprospiraceae bacterium]|nr:DNA primase [Saprospiraceae bacterium]